MSSWRKIRGRGCSARQYTNCYLLKCFECKQALILFRAEITGNWQTRVSYLLLKSRILRGWMKLFWPGLRNMQVTHTEWNEPTFWMGGGGNTTDGTQLITVNVEQEIIVVPDLFIVQLNKWYSVIHNCCTDTLLR